jgi:hypothetical protein
MREGNAEIYIRIAKPSLLSPSFPVIRSSWHLPATVFDAFDNGTAI